MKLSKSQISRAVMKGIEARIYASTGEAIRAHHLAMFKVASTVDTQIMRQARVCYDTHVETCRCWAGAYDARGLTIQIDKATVTS